MDQAPPAGLVSGERFIVNMVNSATGRAQRPDLWVKRSVRHTLQIPLRYRMEGQEEWSPGETLNMSETGVLFSSGEMLEVNARVEITFQTSSAPLLKSSRRFAHVVRRVLNNWPETRPVFGARFCS